MPSKVKRIRWSVVISIGTSMRIAQTTITERASVRVAAAERNTPNRLATTAVRRRLIPSVTAVTNPKMMPVSTSWTPSGTPLLPARRSQPYPNLPDKGSLQEAESVVEVIDVIVVLRLGDQIGLGRGEIHSRSSLEEYVGARLEVLHLIVEVLGQ